MIILSFTMAPITSSILLCFLVGAVMVMVGMMFFTLGAEMSMTPMGEKVGARMTQSKNILLIVVLSWQWQWGLESSWSLPFCVC